MCDYKRTITYQGKDIKVGLAYQGVTESPWHDRCEMKHYELIIRIGRNKITSDYYMGMACKSGNDSPVEALYNYVSDAIYGRYDIDDFAAELGYTKVSELLKAYKGCKKANGDWLSLESGIDLDGLHNYLQEEYNV